MRWLADAADSHNPYGRKRRGRQGGQLDGRANALLKRGWNKNSLPEGTEIVVDGYQSKDGELRLDGRDLTFPDGKKLFAGSSGTGAPDERPEK